ncbi:MAG: hypothetical protein IPH81_08420 [Candidatus Microthrix sp.]|nr:hypothetical protein [Candidatus Microthrix sp.]
MIVDVQAQVRAPLGHRSLPGAGLALGHQRRHRRDGVIKLSVPGHLLVTLAQRDDVVQVVELVVLHRQLAVGEQHRHQHLLGLFVDVELGGLHTLLGRGIGGQIKPVPDGVDLVGGEHQRVTHLRRRQYLGAGQSLLGGEVLRCDRHAQPLDPQAAGHLGRFVAGQTVGTQGDQIVLGGPRRHHAGADQARGSVAVHLVQPQKHRLARLHQLHPVGRVQRPGPHQPGLIQVAELARIGLEQPASDRHAPTGLAERNGRLRSLRCLHVAQRLHMVGVIAAARRCPTVRRLTAV